jgi:mono/diheme cytochrome c family protein
MSRVNWIRVLLVAILVLIALVAIRLHGAGGQARAQDVPGDAAKGRSLAEAWCSECHAVGAKAVPVPRNAPDFVTVARLSSTTALSLNAFLRSNHRSMPNFMIARRDADDIVAYILSLKRK